MKLPLPASPMAGVKQTLINNTRYSLTRMTDELVLCRFTMYSNVSLGFFRLMEIKLPVGRHQTSAVSELGQFGRLQIPGPCVETEIEKPEWN